MATGNRKSCIRRTYPDFLPSAGVPNYQNWILLKMALLMWLQNVFVSCQPHDTVAVVNQSVFFNCSTVAPKIIWYYYTVGSDETRGGDVVYRAGSVFAKYKTDFRVDEYDINGTHFCNLIINTVKESFAGKYECRDNNGVGATSSAQLIVIDSNPVCRPDSEPVRAIGLNDCGLEPEQMKLSCSVSFTGNRAPILKWAADAIQVQDVLNDTNEISNNRVTYNVTLNSGNYIHDTKYMCHATQSFGKEQLCTVDIRTLYAMNTTINKIDKLVGDEVNCSVNTSSHSCHYEWIKLDEKGSSTVSNSSVLKIKNSGLYQCRATCDLLGKKCLIFGTTFNASAIGGNPEKGYWAAIAIIAIILVILILILIVFIYIRRKRRVQNDSADAPSSQPGVLWFCPCFGKATSTSIRRENTSETLLSNTGSGQQPVSFQLASTKPRSAVAPLESVENTGSGKEISATVPKEETSIAFISNSGAGQQPVSFHSAQADYAGEERCRKRKRREDENFGESVDPDVEMGNPDNSFYPQALASGSHDESRLECLTAMDPNNSEKPIAGMAIYKELFVVFEGSSTVEVFHVITFAFINSFVISNLSRPFDIVSCPAKDWLFVYALGKDSSGEIFVIDRDGRLLLSWETGEGVGCLSVTFDSSIILSVSNSCLLKVYSSDGLHLRDVKLPSNILPFHAIRVTEDEFLISYEDKKQKIHGICLATSNGELIRNISDGVAFPRYLSLTPDGGCLIADSKNSRILLLKRTFEIVDIFSAEDGLIRPVRICLDFSTGQLFVADNGDRKPRVMIYEY